MEPIYDPEWVKQCISDTWNFLSAQIGHWNKLKVVALDYAMYESLPKPVIEGLVKEASVCNGTECEWVVDGCNLAVYILGPVETFKRDAVILDGAKVWDPQHLHVPMATKRGKAEATMKIPRPPNAFLLYRKDKHPELKSLYPDITNNEISVLVGTMWKKETPEVRAKYHHKSIEIKAQLMKAHPDYIYRPRRSAEIRRRTRVQDVNAGNA